MNFPRISIVTPSFNQAQFLEETIRSVLLQGYPNLEYFVLDGGSKDNSVEIIKKYSPWLTYWASEPDGGQSNAINRGLVALEAVAPLPPAPSYAHIVLGVALGYLDFRLSSIDWRSGQPRLAQWYATFAQRDAMRATAPD